MTVQATKSHEQDKLKEEKTTKHELSRNIGTTMRRVGKYNFIIKFTRERQVSRSGSVHT